jgi:hypothetical protein
MSFKVIYSHISGTNYTDPGGWNRCASLKPGLLLHHPLSRLYFLPRSYHARHGGILIMTLLEMATLSKYLLDIQYTPEGKYSAKCSVRTRQTKYPALTHAHRQAFTFEG